ncbi:hypothetical protein OV207_20430 [Corallococcus sp. BB11-1]|uniref:hypothetical protein n=1 Tax=Corallococcus sp. BB11-1 TaxID=2996783 RepID=UPI0022703C98|nr:hypothetical protein [Corallococcus sp. BB11-1]MCY1033831.1 hypothetical protein [Corallococcus sp. BB11-1]
MSTSHPPPRTNAVIPYVKERFLAASGVSVLFLIACAAPAMRVITVGSISRSNERDLAGYELLLTGWLGVFGLNIGWYANPLSAIALFLLMLGADRGALVVGSIAAVVGMSSLSWYVHPLPADEGGVQFTELLYPSIGFICWMLSLVLIPLVALELSSRRKAQAAAPAPALTP